MPVAKAPSAWRPLTARLRALRAFSLPVSVLPVLVATAAVRPMGQWNWPILAASAVSVALLHCAGNLLNDYFDFRSGVDRRISGDAGRPGRLLVRGQLRPRDILIEALGCLALAAAGVGYLLCRRRPGALAFALAAVAGLYAYTGPPFRLKHRAMGELLIFVVFGPALMLGAGYAQLGRVPWALAPLSVPVGLATVAILVSNNLRDRREDGDAGVVTLARLAGGRVARALYVALELACVAGLAALAAGGRAPRALLGAPVLLVLLVRPMRAVWQDRRLPDIDAQSARFEAVLLVGVFLAYALAGPP